MKKDIDYIIDNYNTENYTLIKQVKNITEPQCVNTWRTYINHSSYKFIDEFLSNIFVNKEDVNMFKEYIINILDNKENHYGILIIPGFTNGDILLGILRKLGDYYNRYDNPRTKKERLIRHDDIGDNAIQIIKQNQNCHHVYLWRKDITDIKLCYENNKIKYTICNIKHKPDNGYRDFSKDSIFSMLNDYLG